MNACLKFKPMLHRVAGFVVSVAVIAQACAVLAAQPVADFAADVIGDTNINVEYYEGFENEVVGTVYQTEADNAISNKYASTKLHPKTNTAEIKSKEVGNYLDVSASGNLGLTQIQISPTLPYHRYLVMEQQLCVPSIVQTNIEYNINSTDVIKVNIKPGTSGDGDVYLKGTRLAENLIEANKWYTFKMYIDLKEQKSCLYVEDRCVSEWMDFSVKIEEEISSISLLKFNYSTWGDNTGCGISVDNLSVSTLFEATSGGDAECIIGRFINSDGAEIDNMMYVDDSLTAEFCVYNSNSEKIDLNVYLALYAPDGRFKIIQDTLSEINPYEKDTFRVAISRSECENEGIDISACQAKAFAWVGVRPIINSIEICNTINEAPMQLYVDRAYSGECDGSIDMPFSDIDAAKSYIRALKEAGEYPKYGIDVNIKGGIYYIDDAISFTDDDSGEANAPVTYKAYKNETVTICGADEIPIDEFTKLADNEELFAEVSDKLSGDVENKIVYYDLYENGYTKEDIRELEYIGVAGLTGNMSSADSQKYRWASSKLYADEKEMTIARWPNDDYADIGEIIQNSDIETGTGFTVAIPEDKASLWSDAEDLRIYGYFQNYWYDASDKATVDAENQTLTSMHAAYYGINTGKKYYVYNLIEELDSPGEYYIDRDSGILYFYMPEGTESVRFSDMSWNMINMSSASNISFENLTFDTSRHYGIYINACSDIMIQGCTVRNIAEDGISTSKSQNIHVYGCEIYDVGASAITLSGGDLKTLEGSNNIVENCNIHDWGKTYKCYSGAVKANGVGCNIIHNEMYNAPHLAVNLYGNDHYVGYNEIYNVLCETNDAGTIYTGKSWIQRGHVIEHNYFHDIKSPYGDSLYGVYLDDFFCGATVTKNVFEKISGSFSGAFKGGGRDTVVTNNLVLWCNNLFRGTSPYHYYITMYGEEEGKELYLAQLQSNWDSTSGYGLLSETFTEAYNKYPNINDYDENDLTGTLNCKYSYVRNNVLYKTTNDRIWTHSGSATAEEIEADTTWNFYNSVALTDNPGFADILDENYALKQGNSVEDECAGFEDLQFNYIGRYWR